MEGSRKEPGESSGFRGSRVMRRVRMGNMVHRSLARAFAALACGVLWLGLTAVQAAPTAAAGMPPLPGLHPYTDTFTVQHPYNLPESARFSVSPGPVYNAWILKGDKPLRPGSGTGPRTEMRWGTNWSRPLHAEEADVMVDPGTTNTCIMQVKSDNGGREAIYLVVRNGNLYNSV